MDAQTRNYETIFIVRPDLDEEANRAAVDRFLALIGEHGTVTATDEWGKRRLAYLIDDFTDGYYVLVNFTAPPSFIAELERLYNIADEIIRSIVVAKD